MPINNNKKAGERLLSFYWIIIFIIISIAVVSATVLYAGNPIDVRQIESRILADKILECISSNGNLNVGVTESLSEDGINLEEKCGLNFRDSKYPENQFYIEINAEGMKKITFNKDNSGAFRAFCDQKSKMMPICHKEIVFLMKGSQLSKVELFISIKKISQNEAV